MFQKVQNHVSDVSYSSESCQWYFRKFRILSVMFQIVQNHVSDVSPPSGPGNRLLRILGHFGFPLPITIPPVSHTDALIVIRGSKWGPSEISVSLESFALHFWQYKNGYLRLSSMLPHIAVKATVWDRYAIRSELLQFILDYSFKELRLCFCNRIS
jgi:hypothetical protein